MPILSMGIRYTAKLQDYPKEAVGKSKSYEFIR